MGENTSPGDCANNLNAKKVALKVLKRGPECVPMLVFYLHLRVFSPSLYRAVTAGSHFFNSLAPKGDEGKRPRSPLQNTPK